MTDSEKLDLVLEKVTKLDEKVSSLDKKVSGHDSRFISIENRLDGLDSKMDSLDGRMDGLDSRVGGLDSRMDGLDSRVGIIGADLQEIKQRVIKTEIIIENEIQPNIMRVAEGHLDLSRKLDDYMKIVNDVQAKQEVQDIYIKMHDAKLKAM